MKLILQAKHWHIFLLAFLIPALIIAGGLVYSTFWYSMTSLFYAIPLALALSQAVIYIWLWVVGTNIAENVDDQKLFKIFIIIPCFVLLFILAFWLLITLRLSFGKLSMAGVLFTSLFVILPIQFAFVISLIYCVFFVARAIKQAEIKQKPNFETFFKEFILILIFPIGIWFLQPRINRMYRK